MAVLMMVGDMLASPPQPDDLPPQMYMRPDEAALLSGYLDRSTIYLEFGSGGSTFAAVASSPRQIVSVEADAVWIAQMQRHAPLAEAEAKGRLRLLHADIGPVGRWSIPLSRNDPQPEWRRYPFAPWAQLTQAPDLVLIDGRFRLACILLSLLACPAGTPILVHDWNEADARRRSYFRSLEVAEARDATDCLVVLERRSDFEPTRCLALLNNALEDWQ